MACKLDQGDQLTPEVAAPGVLLAPLDFSKGSRGWWPTYPAGQLQMPCRMATEVLQAALQLRPHQHGDSDTIWEIHQLCDHSLPSICCEGRC